MTSSSVWRPRFCLLLSYPSPTLFCQGKCTWYVDTQVLLTFNPLWKYIGSMRMATVVSWELVTLYNICWGAKFICQNEAHCSTFKRSCSTRQLYLSTQRPSQLTQTGRVYGLMALRLKLSSSSIFSDCTWNLFVPRKRWYLNMLFEEGFSVLAIDSKF